MGTLDDLPMALDDLLDGDLLGGIDVKEVVGSQLSNDMSHLLQSMAATCDFRRTDAR